MQEHAGGCGSVREGSGGCGSVCMGAGACKTCRSVRVSAGVCGWVRERDKRAGVYPSVCECSRVYGIVRECTGVRAKPAHKPKHITI